MPSRITEFHGDEMREQIIDVLLDALNHQGHPEITRETVRAGGRHREIFLDMLSDCRPLPIIQDLKTDISAGKL